MNPNPRQLTLLSVVQAKGTVTVDELADTLGVTLQTVRRDVQRLADEGLLARFHGGVRVPSSTTENLAHQQRESLIADGKQRIARQQEIDASIAAKADFEYLYDRPYEDKKKVRVAGPFTVESLLPHRVLGVDGSLTGYAGGLPRKAALLGLEARLA